MKMGTADSSETWCLSTKLRDLFVDSTAVIQVVSGRNSTTKARIRSYASPGGVCGGRSGSEIA
jgi:hypothetical protein